MKRIAAWATAIGAIQGLLLAWSGLGAPSGYAAGYAFGTAWIVAILWLILGLLLALFRPTRRFSYGALACSGSLLITFYAAFWGGYKAGLYDWWGDNMIHIPPQAPR